MERTLDYIPRLDERNLAYGVSTIDPALNAHQRWWTGGVVLDQGREGSCVGHGVVAEYLASPMRGQPPQTTEPRPAAERGHLLAVDVYISAKRIDEWEGEAYDGTSVRAGMLVARERGWCGGFNWAFNMAQLRSALEDGPVVIGFEVLTSMFDVEPDGDWVPRGAVEGGHCALVTGYSPNYYRRGPRYRIRNSWGIDWGKGGNVYIAPDDLNSVLFGSGGEAAIPTGRQL